MAPKTVPDDDRPMSAAVVAVGASGAGIALLAAVLGVGSASGVLLGAGVAAVNLWVLGRLVRALLRPGRARVLWSIAAALKFAALAAAFYALVHNGLADVLSLILGYAALPLGIVLAELARGRAAVGETHNA